MHNLRVKGRRGVERSSTQQGVRENMVASKVICSPAFCLVPGQLLSVPPNPLIS